MVKRRLIPVLYIKNGLIVRSEDFSYHQNIGNIVNEATRYNEWDVDELVYIDISREQTYDLRRDDHRVKSYATIDEVIQRIAAVCFMPLTFGGGIRSMDDIDLRIRNGADKITLNTAAFDSPSLIEQAARKYGSQCVVLSVDYRVVGSRRIVFTRGGQLDTRTDLLEWVARAESAGAGEIFMNSIDRDGKATGYDIEGIAQVVARAAVPVVACGGAGDVQDMIDLAKQTAVSGIAAGNWFHFTERSYPRAKASLKRHSINVR